MKSMLYFLNNRILAQSDIKCQKIHRFYVGFWIYLK